MQTHATIAAKIMKNADIVLKKDTGSGNVYMAIAAKIKKIADKEARI